MTSAELPLRTSAMPRLVTRGQFFALETGERFTAIECSDFNAYARFLQEGAEIDRVLEQRGPVCGFNMLRVWTLMQLSQYGIGDLSLGQHPNLYDRLPEFCSRCAAHGLYVEFTAYAGTPGRHDRQHWGRLCEALQGVTNAVVELVNENDHDGNHVNVDAFQPVPWLLCSHGSNSSQAEPVRPAWDYETFHTNDAPEWPRKVGHDAMALGSRPVLSNENTRCPDRFDSPIQAFDAAAGAALLCAGSCFHSGNGKRSALFEGIELQCATAWADGARSVPLEFQAGAYRHRQDLEGPDDLRVYQRVLQDGRHHSVRIRR